MIHLKTYTTYSLRKSITKPDELIKKCKKDGVTTLAITERGNIYSYVKLYELAQKEKIKLIIGIELYVKENNQLSNLTILCKNKTGFSDLLKVISTSNSHENFDVSKEIATIPLDSLAGLSSGNFIVYSGAAESMLSKRITEDYEAFISSNTYEEAKGLVSTVWKEKLDGQIGKLQGLFGKENFFLELQGIERDTVPATDILGKIILDAGKRHKIPILGTCKPYYLKSEDASLQKIMICLDKKTSITNLPQALKALKDTEYYSFLKNNSSYLLNEEEYKKLYGPEVLENNKLVDSLCESFNVLDTPKIPKYDCPDNLDASAYLKQLCNENFDERVPCGEDSVYRQRLEQELEVINKAGLAPYFLVLWDIANYCRENNWLSGARGSAGGCIISYLVGLTEADPVKHGLIFSRFYNDGRNQPGKIAMPDIDFDLPIQHRESVLSYVRKKYGENCVGNIATFGTLKGAASLKEILRIKNVCSSEEANEITKLIVDEHKISDELAELKKEGEEASILGWSIDNVKGLNQYVNYDDNGELVGEYAPYFAEAIKLEGCLRNLSKHACGVVVSEKPLNTFCPMVKDKNSDKLMVGLDMRDVESIGGMKMDLLGLASNSDIMETIRLIREGDLVLKRPE